MADGVLITGATGLVGMQVVARYVRNTDRRIYALVRAPTEEAAAGRLDEALAKVLGVSSAPAQRVVAVPGDIQSEGLGIDAGSRERLAEEVRDIVHSAASVSFTLPLDESREINVEGTRRVLEFAELCQRRGGLRGVSHVSTAYVAGTHEGRFGEDQLDVGQDFRNGYERSKFEAEQLVRSYRDRLPVQVLRPSIIVGERRTGWTTSFNVLYAPLKAFARGAYLALPGRRSAPVDVVPVDYVADAVFELSNRPRGEEDTYHLVAGARASTVEQLLKLSARYFSRRPPHLLPPALYRRLVHPVLVRAARGRRRRALRRSEVYFPYFSARVRYDDRRARRRLRPAGIEVTPIERYFDRLADFATATRWGEEPAAAGPSRRAS